MTKEENLGKVLNDLMNIENVEAASVVSRSGLKMVENLPEGLNGDVLAAMSATYLASAEHMFAELHKGQPEKTFVENSICKIVIVGAGHYALLIIIARPSINFSLLSVEAERARLMIKKILE